jgi:hypothetical protein
VAEVTRLVQRDAPDVSVGDAAAALENDRLVYLTMLVQLPAP